ncbi:hypothetical protein B0H17DRAFT_1135738 [Mycena rosella]|uniref:Uncharacterized protein n=1 Tax=Mycena rosella TaxID=1033263 RepID=A0AAD7DCV1_MYCRO|nr:hypothetical protein B0H17DRAFT_1135738 [Mycena rosella]
MAMPTCPNPDPCLFVESATVALTYFYRDAHVGSFAPDGVTFIPPQSAPTDPALLAAFLGNAALPQSVQLVPPHHTRETIPDPTTCSPLWLLRDTHPVSPTLRQENALRSAAAYHERNRESIRAAHCERRTRSGARIYLQEQGQDSEAFDQALEKKSRRTNLAKTQCSRSRSYKHTQSPSHADKETTRVRTFSHEYNLSCCSVAVRPCKILEARRVSTQPSGNAIITKFFSLSTTTMPVVNPTSTRTLESSSTIDRAPGNQELASRASPQEAFLDDGPQTGPVSPDTSEQIYTCLKRMAADTMHEDTMAARRCEVLTDLLENARPTTPDEDLEYGADLAVFGELEMRHREWQRQLSNERQELLDHLQTLATRLPTSIAPIVLRGLSVTALATSHSCHTRPFDDSESSDGDVPPLLEPSHSDDEKKSDQPPPFQDMSESVIVISDDEDDLDLPLPSLEASGGPCSTLPPYALDEVERNKRKRLTLEAACNDFAEARGDEIEWLAALHSVKPMLVCKMLCHTTKIKTTCVMASRNAIVHDRSVKAHDEPGGDNGCVLSDLQEQLANDVEAGDTVVDAESLGPEEVAHLFNQLAEYRVQKCCGIRATNKSAAMDGQQTASGIGELVIHTLCALLDLYERTGIRGFAVLPHGNPDDAALPHTVDSDDCMNTFFKKAYNLSNLDLLRNFELHSCVMDDSADGCGYRQQKKNDLTSVRREIVRVQLEGLRELLHSPWLGFNADARYREHIKEQKGSNVLQKLRARDLRAQGCEIVNWPAGVAMERPSKMSADIACDICDRFKDGRIYWHKMSKAEHTRLQEDRTASGSRKKLRNTWSDKGKVRKDKSTGKGVAKIAGKGRAVAERDESDGDSDKTSDEESEKGEEWEDTPPNMTTTGASVAPPSSFVPASIAPASFAFAVPSSSFAPTSSAFAAVVLLTLHLTDSNGDVLHAASPACMPTFNPNFNFNFDDIDFDLLGHTSMGGSMSVFMVATNTTAAASTTTLKKRKSAQQGGGIKKKVKNTTGASDAPRRCRCCLERAHPQEVNREFGYITKAVVYGKEAQGLFINY